MLLLTVLAFFVVFGKVAANKDAHVNTILEILGPLKAGVYASPLFKIVYDHFALLFASLAALIASFVGFFIQIIALLFLFALERVLPIYE